MPRSWRRRCGWRRITPRCRRWRPPPATRRRSRWAGRISMSWPRRPRCRCMHWAAWCRRRWRKRSWLARKVWRGFAGSGHRSGCRSGFSRDRLICAVRWSRLKPLLRVAFRQRFEQLEQLAERARWFVRCGLLDARLADQRAQVLAVDARMLLDQRGNRLVAVLAQQAFTQRFQPVHRGGFLALLLAVLAQFRAHRGEGFVVVAAHHLGEEGELALVGDVRGDLAGDLDLAAHV